MANEAATGFEIAKRLVYCDAETANRIISEWYAIAAMLQGLIKSLHVAREPDADYTITDFAATDDLTYD